MREYKAHPNPPMNRRSYRSNPEDNERPPVETCSIRLAPASAADVLVFDIVYLDKNPSDSKHRAKQERERQEPTFVQDRQLQEGHHKSLRNPTFSSISRTNSIRNKQRLARTPPPVLSSPLRKCRSDSDDTVERPLRRQSQPAPGKASRLLPARGHAPRVRCCAA